MAGEKCASDEKQDSSDDCEETCVFCKIANRDDPSTEILAEDEDIVCFQDIDPGALHHYLVIPKKHIHSCLSLQTDDVNLVKKMADMGRDVLKAKNITNLEDISLGFHVPPYVTVPHLHLHVLAPFSQLFKRATWKYTSFWYLTEETLLQKLTENKKEKKNGHVTVACRHCSYVRLINELKNLKSQGTLVKISGHCFFLFHCLV